MIEWISKGIKLKQMNRRKQKLILYCLGLVLLLLVIIVITTAVSSLTTKKVDTTEGIRIIEEAENADIKTIETKIQQLEAQDRANGEDNRSFKEVFASAVIMGDSITEGFTVYDILNASSVVATIGVELTKLDEELNRAVELNPQYIFLSYGMNDVIATDGNIDLFVEQYGTLIDRLKNGLPDTKIFVNSILPVRPEAIDKEPALALISQYNTALQELCDRKQIAYIDNTDLAHDDIYEEDGIHFKYDFYISWLARMKEVAEL